ncbi:ferritin [Aggregicoccus sp. 17bor-14]|nr:ferritin [Simulacricoccus sp. 17bor-14]MRI89687.1 ferritin [Aggregicoccus sp. 17bor-14]
MPVLGELLPGELLEDIARVRRVLARELETINEYEAFAARSSSPEVRAFFSHLAQEEKEHVAEATAMLRRLDAGQEAHFARGLAPGHFEGAPSPAAPAPAPDTGLEGSRVALQPQRVVYGLAAPPAARAAPLTVGSLKPPRGGSR